MCENVIKPLSDMESRTDEQEIKKVKQAVYECMKATGMSVDEIVNIVFDEEKKKAPPVNNINPAL